jgi:hypothetical protein
MAGIVSWNFRLERESLTMIMDGLTQPGLIQHETGNSIFYGYICVRALLQLSHRGVLGQWAKGVLGLGGVANGVLPSHSGSDAIPDAAGGAAKPNGVIRRYIFNHHQLQSRALCISHYPISE